MRRQSDDRPPFFVRNFSVSGRPAHFTAGGGWLNRLLLTLDARTRRIWKAATFTDGPPRLRTARILLLNKFISVCGRPARFTDGPPRLRTASILSIVFILISVCGRPARFTDGPLCLRTASILFFNISISVCGRPVYFHYIHISLRTASPVYGRPASFADGQYTFFNISISVCGRPAYGESAGRKGCCKEFSTRRSPGSLSTGVVKRGLAKSLKPGVPGSELAVV